MGAVSRGAAGRRRRCGDAAVSEARRPYRGTTGHRRHRARERRRSPPHPDPLPHFVGEREERRRRPVPGVAVMGCRRPGSRSEEPSRAVPGERRATVDTVRGHAGRPLTPTSPHSWGRGRNVGDAGARSGRHGTSPTGPRDPRRPRARCRGTTGHRRHRARERRRSPHPDPLPTSWGRGRKERRRRRCPEWPSWDVADRARDPRRPRALCRGTTGHRRHRARERR
jgi:hypothetical protein